MTVVQSLLAFTAAAALLTVTPGLDTAMVLRTAAAEGPRRAALAGLGINIGCLVWGAAVATGLGALLTASQTAFTALKWAGAAYLLWLGLKLILKPRQSFDLSAPGGGASGDDFAWMRRGLLTNLLNPKIGVFYVSLLPQFTPDGVAAGPFMFGLAVIHVLLSLLWFAVLIMATRPLAAALRKPKVVGALDRLTGGVFIAFGLRLALDRAR
ncbi:LysE family translocator [Caulobacter sp. NIBR2454]|uniref:LysE family translocator n=1 Tax=Caulobacter sp. NIBR2454 TaxID=3015996 RepID=UPI0022B67850|nr:LysE family translocator [Caulobacter sp. NIBR2454]